MLFFSTNTYYVHIPNQQVSFNMMWVIDSCGIMCTTRPATGLSPLPRPSIWSDFCRTVVVDDVVDRSIVFKNSAYDYWYHLTGPWLGRVEQIGKNSKSWYDQETLFTTYLVTGQFHTINSWWDMSMKTRTTWGWCNHKCSSPQLYTIQPSRRCLTVFPVTRIVFRDISYALNI